MYLIIPFAFFNMVVFLLNMPFTETVFTIPLVSDRQMPVAIGDLIVAIGMLLLYLEVVKAVRLTAGSSMVKLRSAQAIWPSPKKYQRRKSERWWRRGHSSVALTAGDGAELHRPPTPRHDSPIASQINIKIAVAARGTISAMTWKIPPGRFLGSLTTHDQTTAPHRAISAAFFILCAPLKPLKDEGALECLGAVCLALRLNN
jgi:hypothetical protein